MSKKQISIIIVFISICASLFIFICLNKEKEKEYDLVKLKATNMRKYLQVINKRLKEPAEKSFIEKLEDDFCN